MVALHFTLAEPLTLLLSTIFLYACGARTMESIDVLLLSLLVLSREVNVLFALFTLLYLFLKQKWRSAGLAVIPLIVFGIWHTYMYLIFPLGPSLSVRETEYSFPLNFSYSYRKEALYASHNNIYRSFSGFVLPVLFAYAVANCIPETGHIFPVMLLLFLGIMITMSDNIWGLL